MNFLPLILTYNNSAVLSGTISKLVEWGFPAFSITVIENGSAEQIKASNLEKCKLAGVNTYNIAENRGWGGAINDYLDHSSFARGDVLIIMAHDCFFKALDLAEVTRLFDSPKVMFVYPQYPQPVTCYYSMLSSFHVKNGLARGYVQVGNHTALFARADLLKASLRYDEEFHVYGGEFEVFMSAYDLGFRTASAANSIIVNPSTDAPSDYGCLSHKVNSLYYAGRRHGPLGFLLRYCVVIGSLLAALLKAGPSSGEFACCVRALRFATFHPSAGMRTYLALNAKSRDGYMA